VHDRLQGSVGLFAIEMVIKNELRISCFFQPVSCFFLTYFQFAYHDAVQSCSNQMNPSRSNVAANQQSFTSNSDHTRLTERRREVVKTSLNLRNTVDSSRVRQA